MGRINWGTRVCRWLGGGLVINLLEYVTNGVVLAANWDAPMKALGRHLPTRICAAAHDSAPAPRPQD